MSALGALGLSACGGQPAAPAGAGRGAAGGDRRGGAVPRRSVGMLSQKLYSEAANAGARPRRSRRSRRPPAPPSRTAWSQADAGDMVAKMDAEVKAGTARDLAFMTDSRFVGQFQNLGDLDRRHRRGREMTALYGEPDRGGEELLRVRRRGTRSPTTSSRPGSLPAQGLVRGEGHRAQADVYTWEEMRDNALEVSDPAQAPVRLGHHRQPLRRRQRHDRARHQQLRRGDRGPTTGTKVVFNSPETVEAVTFIGDIYTNPKYKPMLPPGIESWTDSSNNENWLAGILGYTLNQYSVYADSKTKSNPVYANTHPFIDCHRPGDDKPLAVRPVQGVRHLQGGGEPRPGQAGGEVHGQRHPAARGREGGARPGHTRRGRRCGTPTRSTPAVTRRSRRCASMTEHAAPADHDDRLRVPAGPEPGPAGRRRRLPADRHDAAVIQGTPPAEAVADDPRRMVQIFEQQGCSSDRRCGPRRRGGAAAAPRVGLAHRRPSGCWAGTGGWRAVFIGADGAADRARSILVPIVSSMVTSTTERHGAETVFVGLDNYTALVDDACSTPAC